jgi:hypothetical protein
MGIPEPLEEVSGKRGPFPTCVSSLSTTVGCPPIHDLQQAPLGAVRPAGEPGRDRLAEVYDVSESTGASSQARTWSILATTDGDAFDTSIGPFTPLRLVIMSATA